MIPVFHVGQRVRVVPGAFRSARRGRIAKIEPNHDGTMLLYWLSDGGLFSANELTAE